MIDPPQVRPEEPTAVTSHGGIRGGESQQWLSYPTEPHARFGGRGGQTLPDPYHRPPRMGYSPAPIGVGNVCGAGLASGG